MTSEVQAAAEPRIPDAWRTLNLLVEPEDVPVMRRVRLFVSQKRLIPVFRSAASATKHHQGGYIERKFESFSLLFYDGKKIPKYAMLLQATAKKFGARPELLAALDPVKLSQRHVSKQTVQPGSAMWKYLEQYGFVRHQTTAAAEPAKQLTLVEMLKVVTDNLHRQPRTVMVGGHKVYLRAGITGVGGDYPWLILQRADAQTSTRVYVEPVRKNRLDSNLEVHFRDSNTEPDETITQAKSPEDLMRIILARYARYLRTLESAQAAAEPELETPTARAFAKLIRSTPLTENSTYGPFKYSDVAGVRFGFAHIQAADADEQVNCMLVVRCADKASARIHHVYLCYYDDDRDAAVINVRGRLKYKFKANDAIDLLASITRSVLLETRQTTVEAAAEPQTSTPGHEFAKIWMKFYPDARKLSVDGVRVSVEATDAEPTGIEITMPDHEIFFAQENLRDRKIHICVVGRSERGPFPTVDPATPAHVMLPKILSICVADWKKHQKVEAAAEPDTQDPRKYLQKLYAAADARDVLALPHGITVKARRNHGYCIEATLLGYTYCIVSDFLGRSGSEDHVVVEDATPLSVRRGKIVATISSARDSADFIRQVVNAVLAHTPGNHAAREANAAAEPGVARGGNLAAALLNLIHRVALHVKCSRESTDKIKSLQEKFEAHTGVSSPRFVVTLGFPGHNSGEGVACAYDGEYLNVWYSGSLGGDIPADLRANARNRIHVKTSNPQAIAEFVGRFYGKCLQEYHAALDRLEAELQGVNEDEP